MITFRLRCLRGAQRAQILSEYALIVALVVVGAVLALTAIGIILSQFPEELVAAL